MSSRHQQGWTTRVVALSATVLLHALVFQSAMLGTKAAKRTPEATGPGASAIESDSGSVMSLVLIHLPDSSNSPAIEDVASRGTAALNPVIQIVSPDPTPSVNLEESFTDDSSDTTQTAGDPAMQSALFGRYVGQIDARIQRAWRKPQSSVGAEPSSTQRAASADVFRCQAKITQDHDGRVKEIELMTCSGTPAWQLSLVRAIQRASPPPAPPNPSVFTNVVTLAFEARGAAQVN
jgi:hypothetical protein